MERMKIAFLTNGTSPVPATKGGAVENLIEDLLDENEKRHSFDFSVFSLYEEKATEQSKEYKNSNFYFVKPPKIINCLDNTLLDLIINANINKKLINYSFFEELSDCLAALILSLIMAVVVAFIGKIEFNIYIKVVIQIMVGGLCYAGLSYLTRNKEFSYILNVGMKHFKKA